MKTIHKSPRRLWLQLLSLLFAASFTACSDGTEPPNLEPIVEMLPATGITRTEALVSARVHKRGPGKLSFITFLYGENGSTDREAGAGVEDGDTVAVRLTGLKPGTGYSCRIAVGTASATLRSAAVNFTTQPNERPAVSAAEPLSTGPTGLIVRFDIEDDGGEPLVAAGCEVRGSAGDALFRVALPAEELSEGRHRLVVGGLTPMSKFTIVPFAANTIGEASGTPLEYTTRNSIVLTEAGALADVFAGTAKVELQRLTVSGFMNGDDFRFLRMLLGAPAVPGTTTVESAVTEADLTDTHIVEGGGSYDGARFTETDRITTGLLADCPRLRQILLPASAVALERNALARCTALVALTVSAGIESLLPSEGCSSLGTITASGANTAFTAIDGVLFNSAGTSIVWFPLGKTGDYTLPSTVTHIGEDAFTGTQIKSLKIPASVTGIGRGAFAGSALEEIYMPDNLANISEGLFQGCGALATVRLGSGTRYIGDYTFDGTPLRNLYVGATVPPFAGSLAFANRSESMGAACTLHVPHGCVKIYRNHSQWSVFERIEEY